MVPRPMGDEIQLIQSALCAAPFGAKGVARRLGTDQPEKMGRKRWRLMRPTHVVEMSGAITEDAPLWQVGLTFSEPSRPTLAELQGLGQVSADEKDVQLLTFTSPCLGRVSTVWARAATGGLVAELTWILVRPSPKVNSADEDPVVALLDNVLGKVTHGVTVPQLERALSIKPSAAPEGRWTFDLPGDGGAMIVEVRVRDGEVNRIVYNPKKETGLVAQDLAARWGAWSGKPGGETSMVAFHPTIDGNQVTVIALLEAPVAGPATNVTFLGFSRRP